VAKSEREMKEMMKCLGSGKVCEEEKAGRNVEKTKMMVFNKRKRKSEENERNWERRKIERVNEFKYLDYAFYERVSER
jgi:hypothetical protein